MVADATWFDILELLSVTYVSKYFLIKLYTCIDLYCSKNMVAELIMDSSQTCTTMDLNENLNAALITLIERNIKSYYDFHDFQFLVSDLLDQK